MAPNTKRLLAFNFFWKLKTNIIFLKRFHFMAKLNVVTRPASRVLAMYYRLFSQRLQRIQEVPED